MFTKYKIYFSYLTNVYSEMKCSYVYVTNDSGLCGLFQCLADLQFAAA